MIPNELSSLFVPIFGIFSKTGLKWPLKNSQNKDLKDKW